MQYNWGQVSAWAGIALSIASSIGYAISGDWRRSLYYLFGTAITLTMVWQ